MAENINSNLKNNTPMRVMIAAAKSGSGKTMFTCGLLNLFKQKGMDISSYKCGPDYIDPMFHREVLGIPGGNLDSFFCGKSVLHDIVKKNEHEYAVIEGVMGIYDGLGGILVEASSYEVAQATKTPIILILDAYGSGRTLISLIKGILADDVEGLIQGIILNRITNRFFDKLAPVLSSELNSIGSHASVIGFLPKLKDVHIESRHLGLKLPEEIEDIHRQMDVLSAAIEENCDVEKIITIMEKSACETDCQNSIFDNKADECELKADEPGLDRHSQSYDNCFGKKEEFENLRLAVARDDAFCFYYKENFELIEELGVELVFFSPLTDHAIPDNVQGILLGGGYPEIYLQKLSANRKMLASVKENARDGMPILAECGGFMYLHDSIEFQDMEYPMVGVISGKCFNTGKAGRFGYITLENDSAMSGIRGHEFHYFDSTNPGTSVRLVKPMGEAQWEGMHITETYICGFPHFYYPSNPKFIYEFLNKMLKYKNSL